MPLFERVGATDRAPDASSVPRHRHWVSSSARPLGDSSGHLPNGPRRAAARVLQDLGNVRICRIVCAGARADLPRSGRTPLPSFSHLYAKGGRAATRPRSPPGRGSRRRPRDALRRARPSRRARPASDVLACRGGERCWRAVPSSRVRPPLVARAGQDGQAGVPVEARVGLSAQAAQVRRPAPRHGEVRVHAGPAEPGRRAEPGPGVVGRAVLVHASRSFQTARAAPGGEPRHTGARRCTTSPERLPLRVIMAAR